MRVVKASWWNVYLYNTKTNKSILCKNVDDALEQKDIMELEENKPLSKRNKNG